MRANKTAKLVVVALAIGFVSVLVGCEGRKQPPAVSSTEAGRTVRVLNTVPPFILTAQDGQPFGQKHVHGKVWIATFFFTRCPLTSPTQTKYLARLQAKLLNHPSRDDIHLVSITVDPDHDTAEVLSDYARQAGADPRRWSFLTGDRREIGSLSKDGFKLPVSQSDSDVATPVNHSPNFILVDRARRVRGHFNALDEKALARLENDLEIVLGDPPGPIYARQKPFDNTKPGPKLYWPEGIQDPAWMKERSAAQSKTLDKIQVFCDFKFTDRLPDSGITFINKVVDDAAKYYKAVHYDHGNGVAIADIDGDGLLDIYFVNQVGANQLCNNLGGGRFRDITEAAGVAVADRIGVTASFADIDNDDDPDLYVTTVRGGNLLFLNEGQGKFRDISKLSGLDYNGHSSSAVFFDYDRDGLLDLFLTNPGKYTTEEQGAASYYVGYPDAFSGQLYPDRTEQSILFRNTGNNRFVDVSEALGIIDQSWTGAASPIDANDDGWPDLYVLNMQGHDEYYENVAGKRFVKKSRELFAKTPWGSMGIKSFDFDNDGLLDILITDMHTDMVDALYQVTRYWYAEKMKMTETFPPRFLATDLNHVQGNAFFHNKGGGKFVEISEEIEAENYWPWGLSVGDLNADGFEDVFIASSMNYQFRYAVNSVLLNNRGKEFVDSEFILGVEPRRDGRTCKLWFELDCSAKDKTHDICRGRDDRIEMYGALGTRSSAIFDLDNDGDLDIVTNDFNSEPMVLISDLAEKRPDFRFLKVKLIGTKSNRSGIGARVRVKAAGQTYTKVQDGQSGYLSQSEYALYFGLGTATQVDELEISWPSKGKEKQVVVGPIETNTLLIITEK